MTVIRPPRLTSCKATCSQPLARSRVAPTVTIRFLASRLSFDSPFVVVGYFDLKYGLGVASWDKEQSTMEELSKLLEGFRFATNAPVHTIIMWCEVGQVGAIRALLQSPEQGYVNVQPFYWYQPDKNVTGPVYRRTPAVEVFLVAHKGLHSGFGAQFNLNKDPVKRHNQIIGPSRRVLTKDPSTGLPINIHEKPDWLSQAILADYTRPGQWIFVGGFGAGGDVRGALGAGLNVVAIENDPKQFQATVATMRTFTPTCNLGLVFTHDQIVFGHKNFGFHEEEDELATAPSHCSTCETDYTAAAQICTTCGSAGCPECFIGDPVVCKPCRQTAAPKSPQEVPVLAAVSVDVAVDSAVVEA